MESSTRSQNGQSWHSDKSAEGTDELSAQFLSAAKDGKLSVLQRLLHRGVDANSRDALGQTALHLAAYHGHKLATEFLVLHGVDAELEAHDGMTAYRLAMKEGEKDTAHAIRHLTRDLRAIDLGHRPQSRDIHRRELWEKRLQRAKNERRQQAEVRNIAQESRRAKKIRQESVNARRRERLEQEEERRRQLERSATEWKLNALGEKGSAIATSFVQTSGDDGGRSHRVRGTVVDAVQAFARGVGGVHRMEANRGTDADKLLIARKAAHTIQAFYLRRRHLRAHRRALEESTGEEQQGHGEAESTAAHEPPKEEPHRPRAKPPARSTPERAKPPARSIPERRGGTSGHSGITHLSSQWSEPPHSDFGYTDGDGAAVNRFGWCGPGSFRQVRMPQKTSDSAQVPPTHIPTPPKVAKPHSSPSRQVNDRLRRDPWSSPPRRRFSFRSTSTAEANALPPMHLQSGETSGAAVRRLASESLESRTHRHDRGDKDSFGLNQRERRLIGQGDATEGTVAADRVMRLAASFHAAYDREHPEFSRMMAECSREGTAGASLLGDATVRLWLGALSLGQYAEGLLHAGFDTMERISLLEADDLDALAQTGPRGEPPVVVKRGHRRHLLAAVRDLQEVLVAADLRNLSRVPRHNDREARPGT